jgi:three-Cys-motif partner protein
MDPTSDALYFRREQSQIKHVVLENYLERFAIIVGKWSDGILYVDGFSGPWNSVSTDFRDSSFAVALKKLRSAREAVKSTFGRDLRIKCIILERDAEAYAQLEEYSKRQADVEIISLNRDFEVAILDLVRIIQSHRPGFFPFILIDPTGWSGFSMDTIFESTRETTYDQVFAATMRFPIVQEAFIKRWLNERADILAADGSRTPKAGKNHSVRLRPKAP